MRLLVFSCLMAAILVFQNAAAFGEGLHMWQGEEGEIIIRDKRTAPPAPPTSQPPARESTASSQAKPTRPAPAPAALPPSPDATPLPPVKPPAESKVHPLRQLQEEQQRETEAQRQAELEALNSLDSLDPDARRFLQQMLEHDPQFREQWEQLPPDQRQMMLQGMGKASEQMPIALGWIGLLMQFMYILQGLALLAYVLWAWCMARICAPLGVGSFVQFLIPLWNLYLLVKAAGFSGWSLLLLLVPLVNIGFMFHLYGKLAERLGRSYLPWAIGLFVGSMFMNFLIGLLPFYLLGRQAQVPPWQGGTPEPSDMPGNATPHLA